MIHQLFTTNVPIWIYFIYGIICMYLGIYLGRRFERMKHKKAAHF